eukprot:5887323-Pyramimonas_sp.AAC.1
MDGPPVASQPRQRHPLGAGNQGLVATIPPCLPSSWTTSWTAPATPRAPARHPPRGARVSDSVGGRRRGRRIRRHRCPLQP